MAFTVVVTAARIATLRKLAQQQGIIATQHGEIEVHGVKLAYSISDDYHPVDGSSEVTIEVVHKPFFVPESVVEEKIHEFLDQPVEEIVVEKPHVTAGQVAVDLAPDAHAEEPEAPPLNSEPAAGGEGAEDAGSSEGEAGEPVTEAEPEPEPQEQAPDPEEAEEAPSAPKRVSKKK